MYDSLWDCGHNKSSRTRSAKGSDELQNTIGFDLDMKLKNV